MSAVNPFILLNACLRHHSLQTSLQLPTAFPYRTFIRTWCSSASWSPVCIFLHPCPFCSLRLAYPDILELLWKHSGSPCVPHPVSPLAPMQLPPLSPQFVNAVPSFPHSPTPFSSANLPRASCNVPNSLTPALNLGRHSGPLSKATDDSVNRFEEWLSASLGHLTHSAVLFSSLCLIPTPSLFCPSHASSFP